MKKNIIIIGSRGYKYNYGGWETFVTNLILNNTREEYQFYVPNLVDEKDLDGVINEIDGVICPSIYVPKQGFVTMFTFTIKAMNYFLNYMKKENLSNAVILMLGCKVGPLFPFWKKKLKKLNAKIIINPDGLEWKRDKWAWWVKKCFKISERFSIKHSDYCVCDSKSIEKYVHEEYPKFSTPTKFIAFGAYENRIPLKNDFVRDLFQKYSLKENEYYLIVGRFIPENNYEVMIREFMKTNTKKKLVIISNVEENKFYESLKEKTKFLSDSRILFIGTVYDSEALLYFRRHAYAYIHGHSVGGTNPSLLEALSITNVNILFDVCYNREVGEDACFYFNENENSLKNIIDKVEKLTKKEQEQCGKYAKKRIHEAYTWDIVVRDYEEVFDVLIEKNKEI